MRRPVSGSEEVKEEYGLKLLSLNELHPADVVILAVPHHQYVSMGWDQIVTLLKSQHGIVVDIKSVLDVDACPSKCNIVEIIK